MTFNKHVALQELTVKGKVQLWADGRQSDITVDGGRCGALVWRPLALGGRARPEYTSQHTLQPSQTRAC